MISHYLKIIAPKIPKNGTESMLMWAKGEDEKTENFGHREIEFYKPHMKENTDYKIILVGRNPFTRAVSAFEYTRNISNPDHIVHDFDKHYHTVDSNAMIETPENWLPIGAFTKQTYWVKGHENMGETHKLKLENMSQELSEVIQFHVSMPKVNSHKRIAARHSKFHGTYEQGLSYDIQPWESYYSKRMVKKIQELYKEDFEFWGYDPNINPYTEEPWNL